MVREWEDVVWRRDIYSFADHLVQSRDVDWLSFELEVAMVGEMAGFDPELVEALAQVGISELLDPHDTLRRFASGRGWVGAMQ